MKIVSFSPGLGNQIFQYYFSQYLIKYMPSHQIYGYYNKKWLNRHNGLEIQKVFNICLPRTNIGINLIVFLLRLFRYFNKYSSLSSSDKNFNLNSIFFDGWWQDHKYIMPFEKILFKHIELNDNNMLIMNHIQQTQSVSIHIRRGDYQKSNFNEIYGEICTIDYYQKSIKILKETLKNPVFFIFSDDMEWVKNNLILNDFIYVTGNENENSFLDMYLMSYCKSNIIANSTFSYWAAKLNIPKNIVIYPKKWINFPYKTPDIFPSSWIPN